MKRNDAIWLAAFVFVICLVGLFAVESSNQWWWFVFVVPATMTVWMLVHQRKKDNA